MLKAVGKAKVRDDDIPVTVKEQVLELEVPMNDFLLVDVPDAGDELGEQLASIFLSQVAMGEDMVEQLAARRVLEDDTDVLVRFDNVVESDDVGMFESLASARLCASSEYDHSS